MSKINDDLKRAKDAQREQPPHLPPTPPISPGEAPPRGGGLGWVFLILMILVIACVFIVLAFMHQAPVAQTLPPPIVPTQTVQMVASVAAVVPKTNPVVVPPKPVPPPLKLQGILFINPPQAIVNGQTVHVGDAVNGFHVQAISKDNVIFLAPDGTQKKLVLND